MLTPNALRNIISDGSIEKLYEYENSPQLTAVISCGLYYVVVTTVNEHISSVNILSRESYRRLKDEQAGRKPASEETLKEFKDQFQKRLETFFAPEFGLKQKSGFTIERRLHEQGAKGL